MNIIINDRLEELGMIKSVLDGMPEDEIRVLAYENLSKRFLDINILDN